MTYTSPNSPGKRDVLGRLLFAILAGHRRYAYMTVAHGNQVAMKSLGMNKIFSDGSLRRALAQMD